MLLMSCFYRFSYYVCFLYYR